MCNVQIPLPISSSNIYILTTVLPFVHRCPYVISDYARSQTYGNFLMFFLHDLFAKKNLYTLVLSSMETPYRNKFLTLTLRICSIWSVALATLVLVLSLQLDHSLILSKRFILLVSPYQNKALSYL